MLLEVEKVTKRFKGVIALNNVSFQVDDGEVVGLIGPNGAGKTTLINVVTGFLKPDSGKIKFKNEDITGCKAYEVTNKGIARTFQIVSPYRNLPAITSVMVACFPRMKNHALKDIERKALDLLELVGLRDVAFEKASSLPHGYLRRLEVARVLACEPDLLLLDEPFSGLNPSETESLIALLRKLHSEGKTMIIVEHKLRELMKIVERVIVLHLGEKIADGTPKEIAKNERVVNAYLGGEVI